MATAFYNYIPEIRQNSTFSLCTDTYFFVYYNYYFFMLNFKGLLKLSYMLIITVKLICILMNIHERYNFAMYFNLFLRFESLGNFSIH